MTAATIGAVLAFALSACSTHFDTSTREGVNGRTIHRVSQEQAFAIAFNAIAAVLPGRKISKIDGPVKGYSTWFRFVLDTYTQQVLVVPATGTTKGGETIEGFYFEVSGSGSAIIQGRAKNVSLYERIEFELRQLDAAVVVSRLTRRPYTEPVFARKGGAPASPQPESESVEKRLEKLKELFDRGVISEQEYRDQRAKIIESM